MKNTKLFISALCLLFFGILISCGGAETPEETTEEYLETEVVPEKEKTVIIAERGKSTEFQLVYGLKDDESPKAAFRLANLIKARTDIELERVADAQAAKEKNCEILIGAYNRPECAELTDTLKDDEYAIKVVSDGEKTKIIFAYKGEFALMCAMDRFNQEYVNEESGTFAVPADLDVSGSFSAQDVMIVSTLPQLRDPCILVEDGVYYAYGTRWIAFKNTSGDLRGEWEELGVVAQIPKNAETNYWAPEVHKYNGAYYMFTTYRSSVTGHRGCTIMKSDSPEGPFVEITNGHITPSDWDSIDGTFYVDPDGQPWMVFVHEWTSTDDGIGRMAAAKLSDDLTHFISEPVELFRADDPSWSKAQVTDGCWMYRTEDGQLLMLWSNSDSAGYCVGIARSADGRVDGTWTQDKDLLYSKNMAGMKYDGGHGMLFYDTDGQMYLSIHSPNRGGQDRLETPVFIPVREENGTIVWDLWKKK